MPTATETAGSWNQQGILTLLKTSLQRNHLKLSIFSSTFQLQRGHSAVMRSPSRARLTMNRFQPIDSADGRKK